MTDEAGVRGRWRRRPSSDDDDEGPFFPPEVDHPAEVPRSPRPGPRPRPASSVNQPTPQTPEQVTSARPRPRPRPAASPVEEPAHDAPKARHAKPVEPKPKNSRRRTRSAGALVRGRAARRVIKLVIALAIAAAVALALRSYVVAPYYIPSASMEPTLKGGGGGTDDRILVDKISYHIHDPHEGDIVVFNRPDTWRIDDKTLVKRIIGLPGDIVTLRSGLVYVNGMRLTENYLNKACGRAPTKPLTRTSKWTVPMGDYFVMGDNRCNSDDSRLFGPIPGSKIVGHVFLRVWPLSRFGTP